MHVVIDGGLGTIGFCRPKANAYTIDFMREFNHAIDQLEADSSVCVVVIQSEVPKFFCAGADIATFGDNDTATNKELVELAQRATACIDQSNNIYIAALNGHTLGGGLEIALACDIRLGSDAPYLLGLPEVKLGLIPGNGGSQRLTRVVGFAKSLELCVTGDNVTAQEAHNMGLINALFPVDEFKQGVRQYAARLASGPPLAMAAVKQAVRGGSELPLNQALALEAQLVDPLYDTEDADEGFTAHSEKRSPKFVGR